EQRQPEPLRRPARRLPGQPRRARRRNRRRTGLQLARPGPGDGHDGQPAGLPRPARRLPRRSAGGEVSRGHDAVPGHAARRLRLPAAEHRLPERRDRVLHRQRGARGGGMQPAQFQLDQQDRLQGRHAQRVHARGRPHRLAAGPRGVPQRPARSGHQGQRRPRRHPLHQRHHGPQQGRDADARQPAVQRPSAEGLLGLATGRRADPRAADLPRARPVRGLARRAHQRQQDDLDGPVRCAQGGAGDAARHRVHGRAHAVRAHAGRTGPGPRSHEQHALVRRRLGATAAGNLQRMARAHRPHHPGALRHERDRHAGVQSLRPEGRRAPRRHGRLPAARCRPAHLRRRRHRAAGRRGRRHPGQGTQRLQGLLAHAGEDARGVHARRLVQDRRRRQGGRAWLRQHRRAQQGPDHQRRLQRLPGRNRGLHQRAARRGRERAGGRAAPGLRRGGRGRRDRQARCPRRSRRSGRHPEGTAGQLQDPQALLRGGRTAAQH
ncbi:MAG: Long-chain-fatty-acid--CoA ligase, partial [uncultured Ramlibacter sp.]